MQIHNEIISFIRPKIQLMMVVLCRSFLFPSFLIFNYIITIIIIFRLALPYSVLFRLTISDCEYSPFSRQWTWFIQPNTYVNIFCFVFFSGFFFHFSIESISLRWLFCFSIFFFFLFKWDPCAVCNVHSFKNKSISDQFY